LPIADKIGSPTRQITIY